MGMKARKGQWLVAGGFVLLSLLASVMLSQHTLNFDLFERKGENTVVSRVEAEFDDMLSILVNETTSLPDSIGTLKDYLLFTETYSIGRNVDLYQLMIAGVPNNTHISIAVVNYYRQPIEDFSLRVNGVPAAVTDIGDGDHRLYTFTDAAQLINVTYSGIVLDSDNEDFTMGESIFFDRRAFGILELEARANDYVRREVVVR